MNEQDKAAMLFLGQLAGFWTEGPAPVSDPVGETAKFIRGQRKEVESFINWLRALNDKVNPVVHDAPPFHQHYIAGEAPGDR